MNGKLKMKRGITAQPEQVETVVEVKPEPKPKPIKTKRNDNKNM